SVQETHSFSSVQTSSAVHEPCSSLEQATHSSSTHTGVSPSQASQGSITMPPLLLVSPSPSPEVVAPPLWAPPSPSSPPVPSLSPESVVLAPPEASGQVR